MKNKTVSIEALRFVFMVVIAVWHFGRINPFTHGYIAVDFYFLLSGYLLYGSYVRHKYDALKYTVEKLKRFYPEYIFVFVIAFFMKLNLLLRDSDAVTLFLNAIPEGLMINSVGVFGGGVNPASWYVSVLMVGGGILYAVLHWNKKVALSIVFPLLVLFSYTYLMGFGGSLEQFANDGFISQSLLRGMGGMALGVVLAALKERYSESLAKKRMVLDVACLLAVVVVCIVLFSAKHYDRFALLAFSVLIISCFVPSTLINRIFKSTVWAKLGGITFEMLLVHCPIIWVVNNLTRSIKLSPYGIVALALVYIVIVLICSFALKYIGNRLNKKIIR